MLYEDALWLIVQKPTGVPSVPHANRKENQSPTVVDFALEACAELKKRIVSPEYGLLHRLDTGTSGVLAFAKSSEEFSRLKKLWKTPTVQKHYRAIVPFVPALPPSIEISLAHSLKSKKRILPVPKNASEHWLKTRVRGKILPAKTWIINSQSISEKRLDLGINIQTGVMHQIRCHLSALGCPIVGDPIYGGASSTRLWLHHWRLTLPTQTLDKSLTFEARLPKDWPT